MPNGNFNFTSSDYNNAMTNRIKERREAKGWSMQRLADEINPPTSAPQILRLESGERRLTIEWLERISKALECKISDLMPTELDDALADMDLSVMSAIITAVRKKIVEEKMEVDPEQEADWILTIYKQTLDTNRSDRERIVENGRLIADNVIKFHKIQSAQNALSGPAPRKSSDR